ncbi:MAG: AAA family ATPase [Candidatus Bathyarchaeia archaeon]
MGADKTNVEQSHILYKLGNEYYEKGEWVIAIRYYDKAIEFDPTNYKAYYNRGLAKACMENYDDAIKDFDKVIELIRTRVENYCNQKSDNVDELKKNLAEAYYLKGLCYKYKRMLNEAIREFDQALAINPDFRAAQDHKEQCQAGLQKDNRLDVSETIEEAKNLENEGKYTSALALLEKALKGQPDNFQLLFHRRRLIEKIELPCQYEVCGLKELKILFKKLVIYPIKYSQHPLYKARIAKYSKGILLYGPPGCGKTMFIKKLARDAGIELFEVVLSDTLNLYVGESEKRLTEVFNKAKETARDGKPVIIFVDEVDALGFSRTIAREPTESYFSQTLIATFLRLFNEIQDIPNLIVIGATNRPWTVDDALKRPGRLGSAIVYCPPPDEETREELFRLYAKGTPGYENIDFAKLAKETKWFSGDDIRAICLDVYLQISMEIIDEQNARERSSEQMSKNCKCKARTEDYLMIIARRNPQVKCWLRLVVKNYLEGKIEEYELDERLKKDISDFCQCTAPNKNSIKSLEKEYAI